LAPSGSLKIGIDLRFIGRGRGIGNVTAGLIEGLARISTGHRFLLYSDLDDSILPFGNSELEWRGVSRVPHPLWEQFYLPYVAWHDKLDVLHCVANTGPVRLTAGVRMVLTLHDLIFMRPENPSIFKLPLYRRAGAIYRRVVVPLAAKRANVVTTDSEASKADIISSLGLPETKITVVRPGPREIFRRLPTTVTDELLPPSARTTPYLLLLGATAQRKNTVGVVEAFASLSPAQRRGHKLIVVGLGSDASATLANETQRLGVADSVVSVGNVPQSNLVALYNQATALVYASTWEGFGLPVLEAMACGTAVIASDRGAIAEIAAGAAFLVDPHSSASIARGMAAVIGDSQLRERLIADGARRCERFRWEETAARMVKLYESVVQAPIAAYGSGGPSSEQF